MARIFRDPDGRLHVLNPSLDLRLEIELRRRGEPRSRWIPQSEDEMRLAAWLIGQTGAGDDVEDDPPEDLLARAVEAGLLVPLQEVPRPEPPFRCDLDASLLALLPERHRGAEPEGFEPNPNVWIQEDEELPPVVRDRLGRGEDHSDEPEEFGRFDSDLPVFWILDAEREFLVPLWLSGELASEARQVIEHGEVPDDPDLRERLAVCGVLCDPGAAERRDRRLAGWRDHLEEHGYVALRDMVPPVYAAALRRYFRELETEGFFEMDRNQVVGKRAGIYCDVATRHLQRQLAPVARGLTGEAIEPSYTWMRRYLPGAVLERHLDRAQCRWNLSLCVDEQPELAVEHAWPIWLEVDGRKVEVRLDIGDCVLYRGDEIPHWRDTLASERSVTMAFLHFVDESFAGSRR